MAQTDFTAKQMGKQAVIFGAAALIATFLLSCLVGLLTAGGMLPESAMQVVSMGILCVCVFASSFLAAKAAPGKKLIAAVLSAAVYWLTLAVFAVAAFEAVADGNPAAGSLDFWSGSDCRIFGFHTEKTPEILKIAGSCVILEKIEKEGSTHESY